jgi:hypothetical protein
VKFNLVEDSSRVETASVEGRRVSAAISEAAGVDETGDGDRSIGQL